MSRWQAIVFDMDDTLYPERDYVLSGFRAVAQWAENVMHTNKEQTYNELHTLFQQGVRRTTFNIWLEQHGIKETRLSDCIDIYRSHIPDILPFPEVDDLLSRLSKEKAIGLISDGYLEVQKKKWHALGLESYFDVVTFSDRWGRHYWKPNTKPFIHTQRTLSVEHIVYIGDNPTKDFYGARQCGWGTIWLRRPYSEYVECVPPAPEYAADRIIDSLSDLEDALDTLV